MIWKDTRMFFSYNNLPIISKPLLEVVLKFPATFWSVFKIHSDLHYYSSWNLKYLTQLGTCEIDRSRDGERERRERDVEWIATIVDSPKTLCLLRFGCTLCLPRLKVSTKHRVKVLPHDWVSATHATNNGCK